MSIYILFSDYIRFIPGSTSIGPGILLLPNIYQETGWVITTFIVILLTVLSFIISCMLSESIKNYPDNYDLKCRLEYIDLIEHYCEISELKKYNRNYLASLHSSRMNSKKKISLNIKPSMSGDYMKCDKCLSKISKFIYYVYIICFICCNIIQSSMTMDLIIAQAFGNSFGLQYYPNIKFIETYIINSNQITFIGEQYIVSLGYIVILCISIPMSILSLNKLTILSNIIFMIAMIIIVIFVVLFILNDELSVHNVPILSNQVWSVLPISFFNITYVAILPSWLNEKIETVNETSVLKFVTGALIFIFICIGYLGGISFKPYYFNKGISLLSKFSTINTNKIISILAPYSIYLFTLLETFCIIPILCCVVRYNLLNTDAVRSFNLSNVLSIGIPFIVSLIFFTPKGYNVLLYYITMLFAMYINFILPIYFYYQSILQQNPHESILKQRILSIIHNQSLTNQEKRVQINHLKSQHTHRLYTGTYKNNPRGSVVLSQSNEYNNDCTDDNTYITDISQVTIEPKYFDDVRRSPITPEHASYNGTMNNHNNNTNNNENSRLIMEEPTDKYGSTNNYHKRIKIMPSSSILSRISQDNNIYNNNNNNNTHSRAGSESASLGGTWKMHKEILIINRNICDVTYTRVFLISVIILCLMCFGSFIMNFIF